jgi:SPP1 gp7 family putative phage head morphogenesis protein
MVGAVAPKGQSVRTPVAASSSSGITKLRAEQVEQLSTVGGVPQHSSPQRDQARVEMGKARKGKMSRTLFARESFASSIDDAMGFLEANSFRMAGNLADGARSIIQKELLNAIKAGTPVEDVRDNILERLVRKGFTDLNSISDSALADSIEALNDALGGDYPGDQASYVDTLVRTNVFEAFNESRYDAFTDPALDGFVEALEYSAILDDRTTEICRELEGATWSVDSDMWDTYRPPNHYNCRSVLIPVTAIDGWDGEESDDPGVMPQDGFGKGEK